MKDIYLIYEEKDEIISDTRTEKKYSGYIKSKRYFTPKLLLKEKPDSWNLETLSIEDKLYKLSHLYLVIVRYTDGGTFGCVNGYWKIIDVVQSNKEAEQLKQSVFNNTYSKYKPWKGYFASLDDVEIHRMELIKE